MRVLVELDGLIEGINFDLDEFREGVVDWLGISDSTVVASILKTPEPGTADDKLRPGQTVKEALDRCMEIAKKRRAHLPLIEPPPSAAREFSLAITAMEDAQMRYARGRHMQEGSFNPSDVDRWLADGQDVQVTVDERDRMAGEQDQPSPSSKGGDPEEG